MKICSVDECDRPVVARGFCRKHYGRWLKHGDVNVVLKPPGRLPSYIGCSVEGCPNPHSGRSFCDKHLRRWLKHGDPLLVAGGSGSNHPQWGGDDVGYHAAHYRIYTARGSASQYKCPCGEWAVHWAYDYSDPNEKMVPGVGPYSLDVDRYIPMCRSCHGKHDNRHKGISKAEDRSR